MGEPTERARSDHALRKRFVFVPLAVVIVCLGLFTPLGELFSKENVERVVTEMGPWGPAAPAGGEGDPGEA
jgi:hypothetical protein